MVLWALVLGGIGFGLGVIGPMVLAPLSAMGPMVGIVVTGPGGLLLGLVLGAAYGGPDVSDATRRKVLAIAALAMAVVTLWLSLPAPAFESYVVEATVDSCAPPAAALERALTEWRQSVERSTSLHASADWEAIAVRTVEQDSGLLLTVHVLRQSPIWRHSRPWDRGQLSAGAWEPFDRRALYYVPAEAGSCESYAQRGAALYWPGYDEYDAFAPGQVWPPEKVPQFLMLQVLRAVPPDYLPLLPPR